MRMLGRLSKVCEVEEEAFGLFPAEAGVGDGASVDVFAGFLAAVLDVRLYHQTLYEFADELALAGAVENLLGYAALFQVLLAGVGVVAVHDDGRIGVCAGGIKVGQAPEVFIMIVGMAGAVTVHVATQDGVGVGVALAGRTC